jgi:hypothetical protein
MCRTCDECVPPPPPAAPSPSPSPPRPLELLRSVVDTNFTIDATVDTFDQAAFRQALLTQYPRALDVRIVSVVSASVLVEVEIILASTTVTFSLTPTLSPTPTLSLSLNARPTLTLSLILTLTCRVCELRVLRTPRPCATIL